MVKLFFSYSHENEDMRNELEKHFSVMKRNGLIDSWYDRRILAGEEFDPGIMENLENSQIVLLMVSSDFLASDYCYEKEMLRAIDKHDKKELVVIPVILEPCDWKQAPFGKLKALPTDGKPISKFANMNDAYLEVVEGVKEVINSKFSSLRKELAKRALAPEFKAGNINVSQKFRSSNLRVKKKFSDRDSDEFIDETYRYIKNYFENSLDELQRRNSHIQTNFNPVDKSQFEAVIYENGDTTSECRIWLSKDGFGKGSKDIKYSSGLGRGGSWNESISVENDGYIQFLKPMGMRFGQNVADQLSMEGAAEYFWSIFIEPLQQ
mgnify:FL=1